MSGDDTTVLVVDDEVGIAELYAEWLAEKYDARTALSGEAALSMLDEDVDVVLLDRRMPGLSGDEVLEEIGRRGLDCRVVMVTAVEPDFDVLEMGFDDYIVKPVDGEELRALVERALEVASYDDSIRYYFQLVSKRVAIEASKSDAELEHSEEYAGLLEELDRAKADADTRLDELISDGPIDDVFSER